MPNERKKKNKVSNKLFMNWKHIPKELRPVIIKIRHNKIIEKDELFLLINDLKSTPDKHNSILFDFIIECLEPVIDEFMKSSDLKNILKWTPVHTNYFKEIYDELCEYIFITLINSQVNSDGIFDIRGWCKAILHNFIPKILQIVDSETNELINNKEKIYETFSNDYNWLGSHTSSIANESDRNIQNLKLNSIIRLVYDVRKYLIEKRLPADKKMYKMTIEDIDMICDNACSKILEYFLKGKIKYPDAMKESYKLVKKIEYKKKNPDSKEPLLKITKIINQIVRKEYNKKIKVRKEKGVMVDYQLDNIDKDKMPVEEWLRSQSIKLKTLQDSMNPEQILEEREEKTPHNNTPKIKIKYGQRRIINHCFHIYNTAVRKSKPKPWSIAYKKTAQKFNKTSSYIKNLMLKYIKKSQSN